MTKPRYPKGCPAGSQVRGSAVAASPADYAWNVNFNNGNVNNNDQNNKAFVRAVRSVPSGEYQGVVQLRDLYEAMIEARRGKKPSRGQLAFEADWSFRLQDLRDQLNAGSWSPAPSTCFVASRPKAREIHAPDFSDRIVHHWLVPQLEVIFEPGFIHDSYSNQIGKGTHAAVRRLNTFVREVASGEGSGWYLQLDVANFFNSIHRPTLWRALKRRLASVAASPQIQLATHALLRQAPLAGGVTLRCTQAERARVPPYKRLENAAPGCGLPIGNLSSQFFANVYLDALDQFVKHRLKVKRYLRYVDDFVLVDRDRDQLERWQVDIERFLADELKLSLKNEIKLRTLSSGIDFLGYVIRPTHTLVRPRVVRHCRAALAEWEGRRDFSTEAREAVSATWASYQSHFSHSSSFRLRRAFHLRFPWLADIKFPCS